MGERNCLKGQKSCYDDFSNNSYFYISLLHLIHLILAELGGTTLEAEEKSKVIILLMKGKLRKSYYFYHRLFHSSHML